MKPIQLVGDQKGDLKYSIIEIAKDQFVLQRNSKNAEGLVATEIQSSHSTEDEAKTELYLLKTRVESMKQITEEKLAGQVREIAAADLLLQGWTPPEPEE